MSKRNKITLAIFTTCGYIGKTKVTNSIIVKVGIVGEKRIKERLEKERRKMEERFVEAYKDKSFEMRTTAKITDTIFIDYFLIDKQEDPASITNNQ